MREWKWVQIFFWLVRTISRDFSYYLLFQSWTKDHIFGLLFLVIQNCCEFGPSCLNLPIKLWSHAHVRIWLEGYWDNYFSPLLKHKNNVVSNFGSFLKRKPSKLPGTFTVFRVSRHWVLMKMAIPHENNTGNLRNSLPSSEQMKRYVFNKQRCLRLV